MKRTLTVILVAVLATLALPPPHARAHAALARSTPAPGATLDAAPAAVLLEFTERLDPAFSRAELVDGTGAVIASTELVRPEAPYSLTLDLPELAPGSYTALWRVRSVEDGHVTEGSVPFGVGVAADLGAALPPVGAPAPALAAPPPLSVIGRWLALVGVALAVGAVSFGLLVWRAACRAEPAAPEADGAMGVALRRLVVAGATLLALAAPTTLLSQAAVAAGPGGDVLAALPGLAAGPGGLVVGVRTLLAVSLAALALRLAAPGTGPAGRWWAGLALGCGLLATFPVSGHGAAAGDLAPALVVSGLVHTAAMALWLGGLPGLLVAATQAGRHPAAPSLRTLVRRFTPLALGCVLAVAVSGFNQALVHIGSLEALVATSYGRALLVKLGAFAALLGLGALHWLVLGPRLRAGGPWARHFRSTLAAEISLGLAVLAAAGVQLSVAPSRTALEAQDQIGRRVEARADQVGLTLWVTPGDVGDNLLALDVADQREGPGGPPQVLLRFEMPGMGMGALEAEAAETAPGRFEARGSYLSMPGRWLVEAILRRPGMDDVRHIFTVEVRSR